MAQDKMVRKLHAQYDKEFDELIRQVSEYSRTDDIPLLRKAFEFSMEAHKNQRRYSGEPYFEHIFNVAKILAELRMDSTTIAAGFLHDAVEDTGIPLEEIQEYFGEDIAILGNNKP